MIARLLASLDGLASTAILLREAARTSRRWQTHAARTGFSGALFGVLLFGVWAFVNGTSDPANMGWLGYGLFIAFSTVLLLASLVLAPLVTSAALIEETEDRTLEMLLLSALTPSRILVGKVLSRILVLLTVVLGALPALALVVGLGGVAPLQVVAVVLDALVGVVMAGALGAFYGLFTRSPVLALLATACTCLVLFLIFPGFYSVFAGGPSQMAAFSLFAGTAANRLTALLVPLSWTPGLLLILVLGARLFELRVTRGDLRAVFTIEAWQTGRFLKASALAFAMGLPAVPAAVVLYTFEAHRLPALASLAYVWLWGVLCATLLTWILLRVGVEIVDAVDAILLGDPREDLVPRQVRVWSNPLAWREGRLRAWKAQGLPLLMTWGLVALGLLQTGWWLIPGGALALAALNTGAALGLIAWSAARSMDAERRGHRLRLLLVSPLSSQRILLGKLVGPASLTAPMLLFSLPLLTLGTPYAALFGSEEVEAYGLLLVHGFLVWVWTLVLATVVGTGSLLVPLLTRRGRSGIGPALGLLGIVLGVPTVLGRSFADTPWLALPSQLVAPPLAGNASLTVLICSLFGWTLVAIGLFVSTSRGLRTWLAPALLALLGLGLWEAPARAQEPVVVDIRARPLGDGLVRPDLWTSAQVQVTNRGEPTRGRLWITNGDGERFERVVDLPRGRRDVTLLWRPGSSGRDRSVTLESPYGTTSSPVEVVQVPAHDVALGVLGPDPLGLHLLRSTHADGVPGRVRRDTDPGTRTVHVGQLDLLGLPRHRAAYEPFDQLIWPDADPGSIDPDALTALIHWVASGGHLVLAVTDTARSVAASPLAELLPVLPDHSEPGSLAEAPADWEVPPTLPLLLGTPREGRFVFLDPVWSTAPHGLGAVTLVGLQPAQLPPNGRTAFWRDVLRLPGDRLSTPPQADGPALDRQLHAVLAIDIGEPWNDEHATLHDWLDDIPGLAPLPLGWLTGFALLYLLVIGPVDALVLRRLNRQPLTWVTFPVAIVLFSGVALIGTRWVKGDEAVVRTLTRVDLLPGTGLWQGRAHVGVFATTDTVVEVIGPVADSAVHADGGFAEGAQAEAGLGASSLRWEARTWTLGRAVVSWTDTAPGSLSLQRSGDQLLVVNDLPFALADVQLLRDDVLHTVGPIPPGGRAPIGEPFPSERDEVELDHLRHLLLDNPDPSSELLLHASDAVLLAEIPPVLPPTVRGVRPRHQRAGLLRAPVSVPGETP